MGLVTWPLAVPQKKPPCSQKLPARTRSATIAAPGVMGFATPDTVNPGRSARNRPSASTANGPKAGFKCEINPDGSARSGSRVIVNQTRDFHDTFGVRASASYLPSERVELMLGTGHASNAIPARTYEPAILDGNSISFSAGAICAVLPRFSLGLGYMQLVYLPRDTVGQSATPTLLGPSRAPDPGAKYSVQAGVFNVTADFTF